MRTVSTSRYKKVGEGRGTTWLVSRVFWSSRGMPAAGLVFYCLFDRIRVRLSCSYWLSYLAEGFLLSTSGVVWDVSGKGEKDWETHGHEIRYYSENLHRHLDKQFLEEYMINR